MNSKGDRELQMTLNVLAVCELRCFCCVNHLFVCVREVKGQITQLAMHMESLQEQVNQILQDEPTCDESLSRPPQHPYSRISSEFEDALTLLQVLLNSSACINTCFP